jgi:methyl-accepting chemotaxis protein
MSNYLVFDTVWANDSKGRFIYSNPPEPAGFTNAKDREWFQAAASGKQYISPVYVSVMTKRPCVTVSLPIFSPNHEIVGVLCADLKLDFTK